MPRKNHKPEEIVAKLSQVVLTSPGKPTDDMIRALGVTEVTHYRCVREYVGLRSDQFKRMQHLQRRLGRRSLI
jgi:putative transposase